MSVAYIINFSEVINNETKKLTSKKLTSLLAVASLSLMSQLVQAGQTDQSTTLFKFPEPTVAPASGVTPNFTAPPVQYTSSSMFYSMNYIKGLRVAGVLDWFKRYWLNTYSAPNAAGEKTLTVTCAREFHNPLTGVLIYKTPSQSLTSGLFSPYGSSKNAGGYCGAAPAKQAGNALGLLVETVIMYETGYSTFKYTVKLRVMNVGTKSVKWTKILISSETTLGYPSAGEIVDTNADGTDDLIIGYYKEVTPPGFKGRKFQYTRQVRNIATGALMAQFTWVETYNEF